MPILTGEKLRQQAKEYKKVSKGSDHWLAKEILALPNTVVDSISDAFDLGIKLIALPLQVLLNLNPELPKPAGGTRTICKTPKIYRLWARSCKNKVQEWELSIADLCSSYI